FNTTADDGIPFPGIIPGVPISYVANHITVDAVGDIYGIYITDGIVSGQTQIGALSNIVVAKFSSATGALIWIREQAVFNTELQNSWPTITYDASTNFLVASYQTFGTVSGANNTNIGNSDIVIFSLDINGNFLWALQNATFNTNTADTFPSIVANNGNAYIAYMTTGTAANITASPNGSNVNTGSSDIVIFKLAPLVCLAGDTLITMIDGSLKQIKDIERGDITSTGHIVAKLRKEPHHRSSQVDLITFEP